MHHYLTKYVVLKHQYSRVNQEINPTAFETEKMALAPVTELSQESAAIDGNATLDSAQYQIKFTDIQDLTCVPQEAEDSPLIDKTVFNQILRIKLQTKGKEKVLEAIEELKKIEEVLDAEPEYNYYAQEDMTPNDPYFSTQSWGLKKIHAESAWDITTGSSNVKVGVMEAGIASHADLNAHILSGNFTPAANADLSHGTHVAGIIGAVSNNGIGIAGTAQVALVPLDRTKFVDSLTYANSNHIAIINASFRYTVSSVDPTPAPPSTAHANAIQQYNGLLICSAGNDSNNTDSTPQYPAAYPCDNIISVASTDSSDVLAGSSNYGAVSVDLAAPGVGILSTYPPAMCSDGTHRSGHVANGYHTMGGTSMAAPHVSGVAALIKSIRPDLDALQIKSCILKGVTAVSGLSGKCATGGRLNALAALQLAQGLYTTVTVTGDYNGDGREDLALIKSYPFSDTAIEVCLSTGSAYTAATTWWRSGTGVFNMNWVKDRVAAGDFDGDGKDEIAVFYGYSDNRMNIIAFDPQSSAAFQKAIWRSYPAGTWDASRLDGTITSGNFVANVGSIGKDELVGIYQYAAGDVKFFVWRFSLEDAVPVLTQSVWRQYSAGTFNTSWMQGMVTVGDLDNDGYDEYIIGYGYDNHAFKVLRYKYSASAAGFESSTWYNAPAGSFKIDRMRNRFTFLDFDDVSYKEIGFIYLQDNGNVDFILVNNIGSSRCLRSFTAAQFNATLCSHVSFGDTDGDDKKEMIVIYQYPPSLYKIFSYTPSKTIDYGNI